MTSHALQPAGANPVAALRGVAPYTPPPDDDAVTLKLDANEGPTPNAAAALALSSLSTETLRRYPSRAELESALASAYGVEPRRVIATAGGDDALDRAMRATLEPGRTLVLATPTFEMIERSASLAGGTVRRVGWADDERWPADRVLSACDGSTAAIAVVTPNNPTGAVAHTEDILRVARARPHALVVADLAYAEYDDADATADLLALPNIAVVRTLSKAWGLAGLRVGCAVVADDGVRTLLDAAGGPFPVSGPSAAAAVAVLRSGTGEMRTHADAVRRERDALAAELNSIGVRAAPSRANFVFARLGSAERANGVRERLAADGIAVRGFASHADLVDGLRITLPGDAAAFARLTEAIRRALEGLTP